ncbi:response regulator [Sphingobacterium griseoflavum]|uniref:histidine kinase n=1 Tax=Sphingobacterium griseoflavum TaxID=1474952 RepID=A0ABQ3HTV0_9SPHI|nr:response regulator [Sphingobacterium griseoflavum]GHE23430.1 hypothetical protein GCM10017764_03980 [Sphingobacterium griseoflavum]
MKKYPLPKNEQQRLAKMAAYGLLGSGKDPDLDVFAQAASLIADCPVSLIAMMEDKNQVVQSCVGISLNTLARQDTICQYTILNADILMIEDTDLDERSMNNALVREGKVRFYAGVPLLDEEGDALGTLCVIDYKPKKLQDKQVNSLLQLGKAVSKALLAKKRKIQATYYSEIFKLTKDVICVIDASYRLQDINPAFEEGFGRRKADMINLPFATVLQKDERAMQSILSSVHEGGHGVSFTSTTKKEDGQVVSIDWYLKYHEASEEIIGFGRNVTHELDEKLRLEHSERRFRIFFEHAIGLMSVHDLQGNILAVNEKGRNLLRYSEEEVRQLNLRQVVPLAHHALLDQYLQRIAEKGEDSGMMVLLSKDGQEIYWLYQNMLETDGDGRVVVMSTAINMTERIQLERDLLYTKKILEQTSVVAKVGGWEVDWKRKSVYWSDSTKDIHGVDRQYEPNFESAIFFFEDESQDRIRSLFDRAVQDGEAYDEELRLTRQDGATVWVRVKGIPEWEDGVCRRVFGIIQDIDKSKKLYIDLQRQEAMLQSFVDYVPACAAMFDRNMDFVSVTQQWMNEFRPDGKNVLGENLYRTFTNIPDDRRQIYEDALRGKAYKNVDQVISVGGETEAQHFNWEVRPWHMADGQVGGIIILIQNITDNVRANEELKVAKELADLASKAKSEFLANMSHEIRTPLNGVIGFSDLLIKTSLNEVQQQYVHYINESGNSLLNIINDILDFAKIESGRLELVIDRHDLYDLGKQVVNVVLYQAQRKNLELLLNIEPGLPPIIHIDDTRIKQVLINLLSNAVKFTEHGEIELKIHQLAADATKIVLRLSVRDTGIGIAADKQQRIFDAFTQEDSSVSKKYGGTGLGLTISNTILKYMGSALSLLSNPGAGSIFSFDIEVPYEKDADAFVEELSVKHVLIVDDNESNRVILRDMLAYRNIESTPAADGIEAINILRRGDPFDIVLMDYHMPLLSGIETMTQIKALFQSQSKSIPLVILHTFSDEQEIIETFRREEQAYCLLKPIKSQDLYAMLKRATQDVSAKHIDPAVKANVLTTYTQDFRILIADDNPVNRTLNIRMMQALMPNAVLTEVTDGERAIAACQNQKPFDIILMDVQMPRVDGIEATRRIRSLPGYHTTPIIAITAGNITGEREKCLDAGMTDFLPKPLRLKDLHTAVRNSLIATDFQLQNPIMPEEHLDRHGFEEQVGNDPEFKLSFLRLLLQEIRNGEAKLDAMYAEGDLPALKSVLHKLRGTAAAAGMFKLVGLIKEAEIDMERFKGSNKEYDQLKEEIKIVLYLVKELEKKL